MPASLPPATWRSVAVGLRANDIVYGHDLDRIEIVADAPMPLEADGEDLGDATEVLFEAERDAVNVLI